MLKFFRVKDTIGLSISLVLAVLLTAVDGFAGTYYVNGTGSAYTGQYATYGVPVGNGTGTAENPFLTNQLAFDGAANGTHTIYVAGGNEGHIYNEALTCGNSNKITTWIADGDVGIAGDASRVFLLTQSSHVFTGFTFTRSAGEIVWMSSNKTVTFNSCHFILTSAAKIRYESGGSYLNTNYVFNNCTFDINITSTAIAFPVAADTPTTTVITGGEINITSALNFYKASDAAVPHSHALTIDAVDINIIGNMTDNNNSDVIKIAGSAGGTYPLIFRNNNVVFGNVTNVNDLSAFIDVTGNGSTDSVSAVITGNTFSAVYATDIWFITAYSVSGNTNISNNVFRYKSDNSVAALINGAIGENTFSLNEIYGPAWYGDDSPSVTHAVNFKGTPKSLFLRNKVHGVCYGVVIKGSDTVTALTWGGVYFNYFEDCTGPVIHPKGMSGVPIMFNTIRNTGTRVTTSAGAIHFGVNDPEYGSAPSPDGIVHGNIVDFADSASGFILKIDTGGTPLTCDYNLYRHPTGVLASIGATEYVDLAAWQVAGYDAHGKYGAAKLTNIGIPKSTSPAKYAATNPFVNGDGDQYDLAGKMVWDDDTDAVVGEWVKGINIGAYSKVVGGWFLYDGKPLGSGGGGSGVVSVPEEPTESSYLLFGTDNVVFGTDKVTM